MTCKVICHILQGGVDGPSGNDEHSDDDQFDLDMCYDEYQQESLDRHWAVMVKTFRSLDEVYTFYNKHARERGFSIRKDSLKFSKDRARTPRLRRYLCSAAGKRQAKFCTMEGRTRRLRPESRFLCEAHLTVKLDKKLNLWYVSSFSDDHSHTLARPDEVPFLRSHNQMKAFERAEILAMAGAGIRKHIIFDNIVSRYGSYAKSPFQRTKLYNMCYREKMKLLAQGDADTAIGIMLTRKDRDPDFFFEHTVDAEGRLQNLFWCDSQSRRDYLDYGDVVVFDSTYKMNRYGMPFIPFVGLNNHRCTTVFACAIVSDETEATYVWLLNTFLKANCQKRPKSVITDGDAAMIRAIRKVLSDVWHRLCSWHIEKNMQKHLNHKSLKEFRALLYYATTHKVFEERWAAFVRKWQTEKTKTWLHRMYRKRTLWAASYLSGGFFLGMRSNQRSESLNSSLHLHLDYGMTIVDMIVHYENCIVRLRENEAYDDYTASQTLPVTVTECQAIESYAAKAFTQANFYMLQQDMKKVQELEVIDRLTGTDSQRFVVAWKNNRDHRFNVDYTPGNSAETIKCSCRSMTRKGLPCKHIIHVLNALNLPVIPKCCVLRRFSKKARAGLPVKRTSDLFAWGWSSGEDRARYSELTIKSSEACHVACSNPFLFDKLMAALDDIIVNKDIQGNEDDIQRSFVNNNPFEPNRDHILVRDPVKVSTKGAPKQNSRGRGKGGPDVTKNERPKAFDEKSGRKCSICSGSGHNRSTCSKNEEYVYYLFMSVLLFH